MWRNKNSSITGESKFGHVLSNTGCIKWEREKEKEKERRRVGAVCEYLAGCVIYTLF